MYTKENFLGVVPVYRNITVKATALRPSMINEIVVFALEQKNSYEYRFTKCVGTDKDGMLIVRKSTLLRYCCATKLSHSHPNLATHNKSRWLRGTSTHEQR